LLNQQARVEKVKGLSVSLYGEFSEKLSYEPFNIYEKKLFSIFKEIGGAKGSLVYKVGALGSIKPLSLFAYRFKAYEGFIRWLREEMTPKLVGCLLTGLLSSLGRSLVLKR
jgi:hypothetical protein